MGLESATGRASPAKGEVTFAGRESVPGYLLIRQIPVLFARAPARRSPRNKCWPHKLEELSARTLTAAVAKPV
jgi:hypothetical protein